MADQSVSWAGLGGGHPGGPGRRAAQHVVDGGVGQVELGQVDVDVFVVADQVDGVVDRREHAQAEQVELDQADGGAVVLVPLQDGAVGHAGPFDGDDLADGSVGDDHAAGVDAQVSWRVLELAGQFQHQGWDVGLRLCGKGCPAVQVCGPGVLLAGGVPQCLGRVADGRAGPVGDDVGDQGGVPAAVAGVDVLDGFFAVVGLDVHVFTGLAPRLDQPQPPFNPGGLRARFGERTPCGMSGRSAGLEPVVSAVVPCGG